ncbi:DNA-processing protein DprA [Microbispora sp. NPDC088329]|uniref:DNA-processing protein DprA n=1 Tax=Microbispora sp. NPDC088329 TaxID=3154869 RepID=UPI00341DEF77
MHPVAANVGVSAYVHSEITFKMVMIMITIDEQAAVLALTKATHDKPWHHTARAIAAAGSALKLLDGELAGLDDNDKAHTVAIRSMVRRDDLDWARDLITTMRFRGIQLLTVLDDAYPGNMFWTNNYQPFLWTRGLLALEDHRSVAVVSEHDHENAAAVARTFAEAGLTVVAPLHTELDMAIHEAVIAAGGRTLGVLATGIEEPSKPARYANVAQQVGERGALVSQFWPGTLSTIRTVAFTHVVTCGLAAIVYVVDGRKGGSSQRHVTNALKTGKPVFVSQRLHQEQPWVTQAGFRGGVTAVQDIDDFCDHAVKLIDMSFQSTTF